MPPSPPKPIRIAPLPPSPPLAPSHRCRLRRRCRSGCRRGRRCHLAGPGAPSPPLPPVPNSSPALPPFCPSVAFQPLPINIPAFGFSSVPLPTKTRRSAPRKLPAFPGFGSASVCTDGSAINDISPAGALIAANEDANAVGPPLSPPVVVGKTTVPGEKKLDSRVNPVALSADDPDASAVCTPKSGAPPPLEPPDGIKPRMTKGVSAPCSKENAAGATAGGVAVDASVGGATGLSAGRVALGDTSNTLTPAIATPVETYGRMADFMSSPELDSKILWTS